MLLRLAIALAVVLLVPTMGHAAEKAPVRIGLSAEFSLKGSTSAQAIELGINAAIAEINATGGVLDGRHLSLETRDNRSVPARGVEDLRQLAADPTVVAVFGGRFSPVMIDQAPVAEQLQVLLLDPWSSADGITQSTNRTYTFRLSLMDSLAMPTMMRHAVSQGYTRLALLLPNIAWGRSNQAAARAFERTPGAPNIVTEEWYNWGDTSLEAQYLNARAAQADAILLVANPTEATPLVQYMASLPPEQRLPVFSHWGVTGGEFYTVLREEMKEIDFSVIQTFSFLRADPDRRAAVMATVRSLGGPSRFEDIPSPVGFGHAYDMTYLLALAINSAGSLNRPDIRSAMENLPPYAGLVRAYDRPFTADSHDALTLDDIFMARYRADGLLVPLD